METTIRIIAMDMFPTGTYQPLYSRPYVAETHGHVLDDLAERISRVTYTNPTAKVDGSLIASLSNDIIKPASDWEAQLNIPYGWTETHYLFTMQVLVETSLSSEVYYFNGYSEYYDPSFGNHVDPNMRLFINSFTRVSRIQDPYSPNGYRDQITDSAQVINGRIASNNTGILYGMRPEDVLTGIQSTYLSQSYSHIGNAQYNDLRINKANENIRSRSSNANPASYLSSVIDNYRSASMLADFGQGQEDIYSRAIQHAHEPAPTENPFIRALSNVTGIPNRVDFCLGDLELIDPTVVTNIHRTDPAVRLHHQDDSSPWHGTDAVTVMATRIRSSIAAIMPECMLKSIVMSCESHTPSGIPDIKITFGQSVSTAANSSSFLNFQSRFVREVLPNLTSNGGVEVNFYADVDLWEDSIIRVSVNGSPLEQFCVPSWCDSMLSPVHGTREDTYNGVLNGIESVINHSLGAVSTSGPVINTSI